MVAMSVRRVRRSVDIVSFLLRCVESAPRGRITPHHYGVFRCASHTLRKQCLQTNLRPSFKTRQIGDQFANGPKASVHNFCFSGLNGRTFDVQQMYDAKVYLAHVGFIIVDQADHAAAVASIDDDFLFEFPAHAFVVGAGLSRVISRDMPADADAPLGVKAALALALAAGVLKQHWLTT